ncbi:MAG: hypothetical protein ABR906_02465 [Terracidiphilus sp.]|jgi:hypothetical protein
MKILLAILALLVSITFGASHAVAATSAASVQGNQKTFDPDQLLKAAPATASTPSAVNPDHLFPVMDEKGLLLTCIAPDIEINADTEVFNGCTLAPGRTLNDVMHAFIGAFHYLQNEQKKERADWNKYLEDQPVQKAAKK